jgi:hypothetical protein
VLLAAMVTSVNAIWALISMGLTAGLFVPLFLRWYWPRLTGYGFAMGTGVGILAALVFDAWLSLPLHISFPTIVGFSLVGSIVTSLLTAPARDDVLIRFWRQINPWGLWGAVEAKSRMRSVMTQDAIRSRQMEKVSDMVALFFSVPFQLTVLLGAMAFIFHDWGKFGFCAMSATFCAAGLYFFWYRNLKPTAQCEEEDRYYDALDADVEKPVAHENA